MVHELFNPYPNSGECLAETLILSDLVLPSPRTLATGLSGLMIFFGCTRYAVYSVHKSVCVCIFACDVCMCVSMTPHD